ncbi:chorismate synthase [Caloramator sp. mosi_1]|nr:chorismate synthase [Caloramator sp. mosi_1]WDC85571.1 chorismate synthase [Caloramator sp. mosi_1]
MPAVKGVEFGEGFNITKLMGSEANDEFYIENGKIKTKRTTMVGY